MQPRDPFSRSSGWTRYRRNLARTITASRPDTSPSDNGNLCRPCWKSMEILRENPRRDREIQWRTRSNHCGRKHAIVVVARFTIRLWNIAAVTITLINRISIRILNDCSALLITRTVAINSSVFRNEVERILPILLQTISNCFLFRTTNSFNEFIYLWFYI